MQDAIIGYGWGLFQCFVGLVMIIAGIVGLFARLKSNATRSADSWDKRDYSHRTRCG